MNKKIKLKFTVEDASLFIFILTKSGFLKNELIEYSTLLLFFISIILKIFKNKKIYLNKHALMYLYFTIYSTLSYLWAMNRSFVSETLKSVLALSLLLILLSNYIDSREKLLKVIKYTVISNTLVSLKIIMMYSYFSGSASDRIFSITGIYFNTVGQVFGFSIFFSIILYKYYKNKKYLYYLVPIIIAIILTESRKSILIPVIGATLIIIFQRNILKIIKFFPIIVILILLGWSILYYLVPAALYNIQSKMSFLFEYLSGNNTNDWSITLRSFFIVTGEKIFLAHPIFGIGLNNFSYYVANYTSYGISRYSHNNYIEMLSCLGISGFIIYYSAYAKLFKLALTKALSDKHNFYAIIILSFIISLLIMEWGIVSYSGCMYHILLLLSFYILKDDLSQKEKNNDWCT